MSDMKRRMLLFPALIGVLCGHYGKILCAKVKETNKERKRKKKEEIDVFIDRLEKNWKQYQKDLEKKRQKKETQE